MDHFCKHRLWRLTGATGLRYTVQTGVTGMVLRQHRFFRLQSCHQGLSENLQRFIDRHILFFEEYPCYYIYELGWKGRTQTGLVCVSSIEDYFSDVIKKHEFTRPEKEKDRIDHMLSTRAQTGNVFLACKNLKELNDVFEHWKHDNNAEYSFTADDGVTHTLWVVNSPATIDVITTE